MRGKVSRRDWLPGLAGWIVAGVSLSLALLIWFNYRAVSEWRHSEELLADRRAAEAVDAVVGSLSRNMRGVQDWFLPAWWEELSLEPRDDARNLVASAFAGYAYPESFFTWRKGAGDADMTFYSRSDRPPAWLASRPPAGPFPVFLHSAPAAALEIMKRLHADAAPGRPFLVFETELAGEPYQIVSRLFYEDAFRERPVGLVGFTVNLRWAREQYFPEFARQMARIGSGFAVAIVDGRGRLVAGTMTPSSQGPIVRRWFPMTFFDPVRTRLAASPEGWQESWAVQAGVRSDAELSVAVAGSNRTLLTAAVATAMLFMGLVLTARAARESARVAGMRSEFVSSVTHELKTPIATIRAIGDTLMRGRLSDPKAMQDYAHLVVQESKRLARLIDNLLAYARITDVTEVYAFEAVDLAGAVDEALQTYHAQLAAAGFEVQVDVPRRPPARAGRPRRARTGAGQPARQRDSVLARVALAGDPRGARGRGAGRVGGHRPGRRHPGRGTGPGDAAVLPRAAGDLRRQRARPCHRQPRGGRSRRAAGDREPVRDGNHRAGEPAGRGAGLTAEC